MKNIRKHDRQRTGIPVLGNLYAAACLGLLLSAFVFSQTANEREDFLDRIKFGTEEVKRDALQQLRRLETVEASRIAAAGLTDASPVIRATAVGATGKLPPTEAHRLLAPLLNDSSPFVRKEAVIAIGVTRSTASTSTIIATLKNDKDKDVRAMAAVTLGRLGSEASLDVLIGILRKKPKSGNRFLRRAAARSIGQIAEFNADLIPSETTPENFLPAGYKSSGVDAEPIDQRFAGSTAVLIKVLSEKREVGDTRREAAFALGAIGVPSAAAALRQQLTSEDYYLVEICREALLKIERRSGAK